MRDCATLLDAVAGAMPGDKFIVQRPDRPWANEIGADPGRLRIAVHTTSWAGTPIDPEVVAATQAVARQLEQLGHHVEWAAPSFDWDEFVSAMSITMAISAVERADGISKITGRKLDAQSLENTTLALYEYGRTLGASQFVRINEVGNKMARAVGEFFSRWDLLVTPTMNDPSVPLGHLDANDPTLDAAGWVRRIFGACSFTPLFNWTGTPAISLPLGWSSGGLPIGVQLAAPMCDDAVLMRVGSQLEQAMPWKSRRPTTLAGSGRSKP
jgi:amidase